MLEEIGVEKIAFELGVSKEDVKEKIDHRVKNNNYLPNNEKERYLDEILAGYAAKISSRRHAGYLEHIHSSNCKLLQVGKNVTMVKNIIGTGGPIIHNRNPKSVLSKVLKDNIGEEDILLPNSAKLYLDHQYILYSMGLLREISPSISLRILKKSLKELN